VRRSTGASENPSAIMVLPKGNPKVRERTRLVTIEGLDVSLNMREIQTIFSPLLQGRP